MDYGKIIGTTSDIASQLKRLNKNYDGRRTWAELYGNVNLSETRNLNQASLGYYKNLADAYASSRRQLGAVAGSNLGSGFKQDAYADIENSLQQAYASYRQNYLSQQSTIASTASEARGEIDKALNTEATNTRDFLNSTYDYLANLYERSQGTDQLDADEYLAKLFGSDPLWNRYTNNVLDEKGNPVMLTDAEGNKYNQTTLLSKQELLSRFYDAEGNITDEGKDFYDQMLNALSSSEGSKYSFGAYLSEANPELFEWARTANPYNYTADGTNLGTVKTLLGLDSMNYDYTVKEGVTSLINSGQYKDYYIVNKPSEFTIDTDIKTYETSIKEMIKFASDYALTEDFSKLLGTDVNNISQAFKKYDDETIRDEFYKHYGITRAHSKAEKEKVLRYLGYDVEKFAGEQLTSTFNRVREQWIKDKIKSNKKFNNDMYDKIYKAYEQLIDSYRK